VIRKALFLAALAGAAWWLLSRRESERKPRLVIGYGDGSSVVLEEGSPGRERMLAIARGVVQA
jgi:hypothetical protein